MAIKDFACQRCGLCCGPVPISNSEFNQIKKAVSQMTVKEVNRLRRQKRDKLTCMFYDTQKRQCSIYEDRPEICRMFGFYQKMECPNNPQWGNKSVIAGIKRLSKSQTSGVAGILTVNIGWAEFSKG